MNLKRESRTPLCMLRMMCLAAACVVLPRIVSGQILTVGLARSVYLIKYGQSFGTGFILHTGEKEYLVTAAHVVGGMKSGEKIGVRTGWDRWEEFAVTRVPIPSKVDIAVLVTDRPISLQGEWIEVGSTAGLDFNLAVHFLGFPYGGELNLNGRTYRLSSSYLKDGLSFPIALVKHGVIAGWDNRDPDSRIIFIDAINNPGFSGSPVVFWDSLTKLPKVFGVVTARLPEQLMVPDGAPPPPLWDNSGIVIAHDISGALKAIQQYVRATSPK